MANEEINKSSSVEVHFAQRLASNEKKIRDRTMKKLRKWLEVKSMSKKDKAFTEADFLKIWKGLHYCLWMQDKPILQEEMCAFISKLVHVFTNIDTTFLFIKVFLETEAREWNGIDRWRMDKFMMLFRNVLTQSFELLKKHKWKKNLISKFVEILSCKIMTTNDQVTDGLKIHLSDIYLDELEKVATNQLPAEKVIHLLEPFTNYIQKSRNTVILKRVLSRVFDAIIKQTVDDAMIAAEKQLEKEGSDEEDNEEIEMDMDEDAPIRLQFDFSALSETLFKLGSSTDCVSKNRNAIYTLVKKFKDLEEGILPVEPEDEEPVDSLSKKDISRAVQSLESMEAKENKKKRKKRRKKQSKDSNEKDNKDSGIEVEKEEKKGKRKNDRQKENGDVSPPKKKKGMKKSEEEEETAEHEHNLEESVIAITHSGKKDRKDLHGGVEHSGKKDKKEVHVGLDMLALKHLHDIESDVETENNEIKQKGDKSLPQSKKAKRKSGKGVSEEQNKNEKGSVSSSPGSTKKVKKDLLLGLDDLALKHLHENEEENDDLDVTLEILKSNQKKKKTPKKNMKNKGESSLNGSLSVGESQGAISKGDNSEHKVRISETVEVIENEEAESTVNKKRRKSSQTLENSVLQTPKQQTPKVKKNSFTTLNDSAYEKTPSSEGPGFAKFDKLLKTPPAFVKKSVSKLTTPKSAGRTATPKSAIKQKPLVPPASCPANSKKHVIFDMKKNESLSFQDSIQFSPDAFNPTKQPDHGIIKTPSPALTRSKSAIQKQKRRASTGVITRKRPKAADFF